MADQYTLRLPAIQIRQGTRHIYCFAVDGKVIHDFTTVSRAHRTESAALQGYQRPEVMSHIRSIRRYLESAGAMLPNAIVLAFDSRVRFESSGQSSSVEYSTPGELVIPVDEGLAENEKPALLVDGQQRSAAIRDADVADFPVAAVGFIADDAEEQRAQFILVNNTKALPKGLIHELLPETTGHLPPQYERRRLPATVMTRFNGLVESPMYQIIATPTSPDGYIKDNSVLRMIENSLYDGALYQYRNSVDGSGDVDQMLSHLMGFWSLVKRTWPEAWGLPPTKSRLTHGAGIQALGYVMDSLTEGTAAKDLPDLNLEVELAKLSSVTAWTSGVWRFSDEEERRWNGIQNTPNDVRVLTNFLVRTLKSNR